MTSRLNGVFTTSGTGPELGTGKGIKTRENNRSRSLSCFISDPVLFQVQCGHTVSFNTFVPDPAHYIYFKVHLASYYPTFCTSHKCIIQGVGTVVSGTTLKGVIRINDTLLLGPDSLGQFQPIAVKSIHRKRMPVREVRGGQTASFALKKVCIFVKFNFFGKEMLRSCVKNVHVHLRLIHTLIFVAALCEH